MAKFEAHSIWKVFTQIRDNELLLPNVQRPLVWEASQVENLFDSLYRGYPVGTALVWRSRKQIECRRFIVNFNEKTTFYGDPWPVPEAGRKSYVLDGQQRMQAIYIALGGSYQDQTLHIVIPKPTDGSAVEPRFEFMMPGVRPRSDALAWPLRQVVNPDEDPYNTADQRLKEASGTHPWTVEDAIRTQIRSIVSTCHLRFCTQDAIFWFVADEEDNKVFRDFNNVVEVFIRVNDGGTKLSRSDLVFTLTKAKWGNSGGLFEDLVADLNQKADLGFDIDELLKAALLLTDQDPNVTPSTFQKDDAVDKLKQNWSDIDRTLRRTVDFLTNTAQIRSRRLLPSLNAVLPIAYYLHHTREQDFGEAEQIDARRWLYRSLLERVFSASAMHQVRGAVEVLRTNKSTGFPYASLCQHFSLQPKGIEEYRLDIGKRSLRESLLPLFLAYLDAGLALPHLEPLWNGSLPHVDHIIPRSKLNALCAGESNPIRLINNIGNYRILGRVKNIAKGDKWLGDALNGDEWNAVRSAHLLPELDFDLRTELTLEQYKTFLQHRRNTLLGRLNRIFAYEEPASAVA